MRKAHIPIFLPVFIFRLRIWLLLLYRRLRYGFAFRKIPLTQGKFALVDPEDYKELSKYKWYAVQTPRGFYAVRMVKATNAGRKQIRVRMHHQVLGLPAPLALRSISEAGSFIDVSTGEIFENPSATKNSPVPVPPVARQTQVQAKLKTQNYYRCLSDGFVIDHINHNGLDNRKSNLRICTMQQNSWNVRKQRRNCTSQYKGVAWHKGEGKWQARIICNAKAVSIGYFDDEKAAAIAYDAKAKELFGEYAAPNLP